MPAEQPKQTFNCQHYARSQCGGCSTLHLPYEQQLAAKRKKVEDALATGISRLPPEVKAAVLRTVTPVQASPSPFGYRASAKVCLHEDRFGRKAVGLYKRGSRVVIDVFSGAGACPANVPLVTKVVRALFDKKNLVPARFYDHQGRVFQKNRLRFLTVRTSPGGGQSLRDAAVIISHTGVEKKLLVRWLTAAGLSDLCVYESRLTRGDTDNITGRFIDHLNGPEAFPYQLNGEVYDLSPASFFQANHSLAPGLINAATSFSPGEGDTLLDLYGGFGAYSFALKDRFQRMFVVDGNKAAIATANAHAKKIALPTMTAVAGMCEQFLEEQMPKEDPARVTHVIANPSRAGMSPRVLKELTPARFPALKEFRYVSCNPETFSRDLRSLLAAGFTLTRIEPFDMFPQTDHVELVASFTR